MMRVKILQNNKLQLLERDINEFLEAVGSNRSTKVSLVDIKLTTCAECNQQVYTAMVVYNEITIT